jgi:hypothetical protein
MPMCDKYWAVAAPAESGEREGGWLMSVDWKGIFEKAVVGVVAAVVLGALTLIWNQISNGGLIRLLGGATHEEVAKINPTPAGTVAAFDLPNGCPEGWTMFEPAISRTIVGAVTGRSAEAPTKDMNQKQLTARQYRFAGGEESHILTIDEMPKHTHSAQGYGGADASNAGRGNALYNASSPGTGVQGGDKAHNIMPPFIALFYCKKDGPRIS